MLLTSLRSNSMAKMLLCACCEGLGYFFNIEGDEYDCEECEGTGEVETGAKLKLKKRCKHENDDA